MEVQEELQRSLPMISRYPIFDNYFEMYNLNPILITSLCYLYHERASIAPVISQVITGWPKNKIVELIFR